MAPAQNSLPPLNVSALELLANVRPASMRSLSPASPELKRTNIMHNPGQALLWEIWRKNLRGNLIVLGAIPVLAALCWLEAHLRGGQLLPDFLPFPVLVLIGCIGWTFSVFAFTESDSRRGFTGIP